MFKNLHKIISNLGSKQLVGLLAVVVVVAIGMYLLIGGNASAPYASVNANNGNLASPAVAETCSGATDNSCVVFGSSSKSNSSVILGMNGASGYGQAVATTLANGGITAERISWTYPSTTQDFGQNYQTANSWGITGHMAILNTPDDTPLSNITPAAYASWAYGIMKANPAISLWEVINEPYLKGPGDQGPADPTDYGADFLALYNDVQGITSGYSKLSNETLVFMFEGSYSTADYNGGGWLHDAVCANGGTTENCSTSDSSDYSSSLAHAIENEAVSIHNYGGVAQTDYNNDNSGPSVFAGANQPVQADNVGNSTCTSGSNGNYCATPYCPSGCSVDQMLKDWLGPTFGTASVPPLYATEYGTSATPDYSNQVGWGCTTQATYSNGATDIGGWTNCTQNGSDVGYNTPCTAQQYPYESEEDAQAYLLTEAYNDMLKDPNVKGIYWFEAVDNSSDSPGPQGIIYGGPGSFDNNVYSTSDGVPTGNTWAAGTPKPAMTALANIAKNLSKGVTYTTPSCTP